MKTYIIHILIVIALFSCNNKEDEQQAVFPKLTGKYLGQEEPGLEPEIFAPGVISTGMAEINSTFSPDFKEFYYSIRIPNGQLVIMVMKYVDERWNEPEVAPFSGVYSDADPFITYDGKSLYYISKRPVDSAQVAKSDWDIWRVNKVNDKWSEPERLGNEINSDADDTYPTLTKDNKLYFSSGRENRFNKDIYCATYTNGEFTMPTRLDDIVNSYREGDVFISPNENYMIFASFGREIGAGLYITFNKDGQWTLPQRMSDKINKTGREFCPIMSPDEKYFFYTSSHTIVDSEKTERWTYKRIKEDFKSSNKYPQRGRTDIYWLSSKVIDEYRMKAN